MQKSLLFGRAMPAVLHADPVAVGQSELRDIERVAESMLGNMRIGIAIHTAARISGDLFDFDDRLAEPAQCRGLHRSRNPTVECGNNRAGERRRGLHFNWTA